MYYQVQQNLFAVQFTYPENTFLNAPQRGKQLRFFRQPLMLDDRMPSEVHIIKLTVEQHHKVQWEYDDKDATPKHDGFILKGDNGLTYANNYPRAGGSQVSDESSRRFKLFAHDVSEMEKYFEANPDAIYQYHLLSEVLEKMQEGIRNLRNLKGSTSEQIAATYKANLVEKLYNKTVEQFYKSYPGYNIEVSWKKPWENDETRWAQVNLYKRVTDDVAASMAFEEILRDFKSDDRFEVKYPDGDLLCIEQSSIRQPFIESGPESVDYIQVYYAELKPTANTQVHETYEVLTPEYFTCSDVDKAIQCFIQRAGNVFKAMSKSGLGETMAVVAEKYDMEEIAKMSEEALQRRMEINGSLKVRYANGANLELKVNVDTFFTLAYTEAPSKTRSVEESVSTTAIFPRCSPIEAIKVFKKVVAAGQKEIEVNFLSMFERELVQTLSDAIEAFNQ